MFNFHFLFSISFQFLCTAPTELVSLYLLLLQRFRSCGTFLSSDLTDETDVCRHAAKKSAQSAQSA